MIQTSLSDTTNSVNISRLAQNSILILSLQTASVILMYLVQVYLARWMGRTEYGIYEYTISWSLILAIPVGLGLPRAVLRFISEYRVRESWEELRGLLLSSWQITIVVGIVLSLGSMEIISVLNCHHSLVYAPILFTGVWLIPLQALLQLHEDMARGLDNISVAYGPSKVLLPLFVLLGGFFLFNSEHHLSSIAMIRMALLVILVVVIFQFIYLWFKFDREIGEVKPTYLPRQWLLVALPLLLTRAFDTLLEQLDIIMLGGLTGTETVGAYTAAVKTAIWTSFIFSSLNLVITPTYGILYTENKHEQLQEVALKVTLWAFVPTLIIGITIFAFSQPLLNLFGSGFSEAEWALRLLVIGRFLDVVFGTTGNLMMMTGYQNKLAIVLGTCTLINVVLNALLIPLYGVVGAAIATTSSLIIWNVWLLIVLIRNININPSIFYVLKLKTG